MVSNRQTLIAFDDTEEFGPKLKKQAEKECAPGDRPSVSRVIRRYIRAGLICDGLLKERKKPSPHRDTEEGG